MLMTVNENMKTNQQKIKTQKIIRNLKEKEKRGN